MNIRNILPTDCFKQNGTIHLTNTVRWALADQEYSGADAYNLLAGYLHPFGPITYGSNDVRRIPAHNCFTFHTDRIPGVARYFDKGSRFYTVRLPKKEIQHQHERLIAHIRYELDNATEPRQTPEPRGSQEPTPQDPYVPEPYEPGMIEPEPEPSPEPEPTPEPVPVPQGTGHTFREKCGQYRRAMKFLRKFVIDRKLPARQSMRLNIDAVKLIAEGLPVEGLISNVCSQFDRDTVTQAGHVHHYDWCAWGRENHTVGNFDHGATPAIVASIKANVPVWIWGVAGIGKSVGVKKYAEDRGLDYFESNLSGMQASSVTGKDVLDPNKDFFVHSQFCRAYEFGGVWNGEEIDAAHPSVLTALNNAIASDEYFNPATQKSIRKHENFRIVVTANTCGTGAANGFIRNKIDAASTDRFQTAMFHIGLDEILEDNILDSMIDTIEATL